MGEIDDAAEREDERQAERDQQVVDAVKQAIEDLLQDEGGGHGRGPGGARRGVAERRPRRGSASFRSRGQALIEQAFSSGVEPIASSGSFGPGVGALGL